MHDSPLPAFIDRHPRLFVLTGAGCSTASGIPDYRDADGEWKRAQPVTYQAFVGEQRVRQRYWARSLAGWPQFRRAQPNAAHAALARLQTLGYVGQLVTQNVDRLHQAAGSRDVIDLHGRLDQVCCLRCGQVSSRDSLQQVLLRRNPAWRDAWARAAPDGDADLEGQDFTQFDVPDCPLCGGMLKPDVVFFGESVPKPRVDAAMQALQRADAMLIVGSSLMVYSGYRFALAAAREGIPMAAVNLGRTRADHLLAFRMAESCASALVFLLDPARMQYASSPEMATDSSGF